MSTKSRVWSLAAALCGVALIGAVATAGSADAQDLKKVRLGYGVSAIDPSTAPWLSAANTGGFWKEEGLDVEVTGFNGAGPALQLLANGQLDAVFTGTPNSMALIEEGAPIIAVANAYDRNHIYPVVLKSSPIKSVKDFAGKRMGIQTMTGSIALWTRVLLQANGMTMDDLSEVIPVGTGAPAVQALESGNVDILTEWHGHYALIETQFGLDLRRLDDDPSLAQNSFVQAFFVRKEAVENDPEMVEGLIRGVAKGIVFAIANPEATALGHFKQHPRTQPTGVPLDQAVATAAKIISLNVKLSEATTKAGDWGYASTEQVERVRDVLVEAGILEDKLPADKYYTSQFIKAANDFDHEAVSKAAASAAK